MMNPRNPFSNLFTLITLVFSFSAQSDQVSLKNGDMIHGSLISQDEKYITWESEIFGIIDIPLDQVALIDKESDTLALTPSVSKKESFKGIVGLSGTYLGGNEERDDLDLSIGITFETKGVTHKAAFNYETLGQENEATTNDYGIEYGIDWVISEHWYWGNNFFFGADDKRQIDQSVSAGTNLGYQFWKDANGSLSTDIGLSWIDDKFFSMVKDERLAWVWSSNYQKQLNKNVSLYYSHELNVSLKDSDNKQLSSDIGIIIPVTEQLDTKITWDLSIDNQPEPGNERIDRKLKFGIDYSLQ
jgi:putative salt-induced outer membrane protein YdiY